MRELYKDVQIDGSHYRISKMTARNGSWIAMQVMSYMLPSAVQMMAVSMGEVLPTGNQSRSMTETEFHNIQDACLAVCTRERIEPSGATLYFPLLHDSGRWNFPDLETDVITIMTLTIYALMFSLQPFFEEGAMAKLMAAVSQSSPTTTAPRQPATLTDSSSDPLSQDTGDTMKHGTARIS